MGKKSYTGFMLNCFKKSKKLTIVVLGWIDMLSSARLFAKYESVLVFHEISDTPCKLSVNYGTSTSTTLMNKLLNEYENGTWMSTLKLKFTFDDGFLVPFDILSRIEDLNIPTTFFVNALTIDTGLDYQIVKKGWSPKERNTFKLSKNEARILLTSLKSKYKESDLIYLQGGRQNWSAVKDLYRRGFTIGDHFLIHLDMQECSGEVIETYLEESAALFLKNNIVVEEFALPYGGGRKKQVWEILSFGFNRVYGGSAWNVIRSQSGCIPRVQISEGYNNPLMLRGELLLNRLTQSIISLLRDKQSEYSARK